MPETSVDILARERTHLAESRAALERMRLHTASLEAFGGDHVSTEHLKQALYRRMKALQDDPTVPLFFGRLDYEIELGAEQDEILYIGRRHVTGEAGGEPLVIDWRAGMSRPFYQARPGQSMGVRLRRRFGFSHGQLTAYEDEDLVELDHMAHSEIMESEIERPRTGPMRDIVATIQPEQDSIVRAALGQSLCIQGAPGTGKTAIGLHRAAYLLYAFREQLARSGVLVVGPNDSFLSYIADVLPALGEIDAAQTTVTSLVCAANGVTIRGLDSVPAALIKGDARMAEVLHRAVWSHLGTAREPLVVPRGAYQWRVGAYLIDGDRRRAAAARRPVRRRSSHAAAAPRPPGTAAHGGGRRFPRRPRTGCSCPQQAGQGVRGRHLAGSRRAKLIMKLLTDAEFLAAAADGLLSADGAAGLIRMRRPPRSVAAARWSLADVILIDEVTDLLQRTPSRGHVILDEAQDLSPMMLRAVGRRASTGSVTVLGDLAQATTPWATRSWQDSLAHLGHPDAAVEELVAGFRVPGAVIDFAARLLPHIAPALKPPHSVRTHRGELDLRLTARIGDELAEAINQATQNEGTVGVIVADAAVPGIRGLLDGRQIDYDVLGEDSEIFEPGVAPERSDPGITPQLKPILVPATLAKGLEFDHVVLLEPADIVAGEPDHVTGLRRLYVCLTRAVTSLVVVYATELPTPLAA